MNNKNKPVADADNLEEFDHDATDANAANEQKGGTDPQIEQYRQEAAASKDQYMRLAAEFDNYRKRSIKERAELVQIAGKDIVTTLLDVLDDAERAEKQMLDSNDTATIKEGITLVFNKLRQTLQAKGLKAMEAVGADFDPEIHEAITEIPAPAPDMEGKVIDQVSKGYYLNDKIIRHAKVVVGK